MKLVFYDNKGKAICYSEDKKNIFSFNGQALGYIEKGNIFLFNGKHIGWFEKGWVIDHDGDFILFTNKSKSFGGVITPTKDDIPLKEPMDLLPLKDLQDLPPLMPLTTLEFKEFEPTFFEDESLNTSKII